MEIQSTEQYCNNRFTVNEFLKKKKLSSVPEYENYITQKNRLLSVLLSEYLIAAKNMITYRTNNVAHHMRYIYCECINII